MTKFEDLQIGMVVKTEKPGEPVETYQVIDKKDWSVTITNLRNKRTSNVSWKTWKARSKFTRIESTPIDNEPSQSESDHLDRSEAGLIQPIQFQPPKPSDETLTILREIKDLLVDVLVELRDRAS